MLCGKLRIKFTLIYIHVSSTTHTTFKHSITKHNRKCLPRERALYVLSKKKHFTGKCFFYQPVLSKPKRIKSSNLYLTFGFVLFAARACNVFACFINLPLKRPSLRSLSAL